MFMVLLFSCSEDTITASDEVTSKNYEYNDYTALEINDNFKVFLTFSDTEENFEVKANTNLHQYIKITQSGNKITVKLDGVGQIRGNEILQIYITTQEITDINLKGNTNLTVEELVNPTNVNIELTGNCFLSGSVNIEQMNLKATGNCMIDLSGNVGSLDAKLVGNCQLTDYYLTIDALKINLSGNSNAQLTVDTSISIDGSGNSILYYKGNPSIIHQNLSSNSKLIRN
ncbi:hypothetical protein A9996_11445 [Gelidibacter algens]|nr:hypothetical protein A9996_11445 [Gelidibacter algens]